jgi:hypothetical protein
MNAFHSLPESEHLLYTLRETQPSVIASTLLMVKLLDPNRK